MPFFLRNSTLYFLVIIAAISQYNDFARVIFSHVAFEASLLDVGPQVFMLSLIWHLMLLAIGFTVKRYRREGDQDTVYHENNVGLLMTDYETFPMMKLLGIFSMQTGSMLQSAVNNNGNFPWQIVMRQILQCF